MTVTRPPARSEASADVPGGGAADGAVRNAPVIVLTYGNAGVRRFQQLLEAQQELACTTGTGVLAACDQAAAAWRQADGRAGLTPSSLAGKSIRAMAAQMIMIITVRSGRPRWCETAAAERSAAETFLKLFPETRFVCLHRACQDVIAATLRASPWGIAGPGFASYVAAYPGSTVAALAAWWAAHTAPLLAFERDHPGDCLRIRYEDLTADPGAAEQAICAFLALSGDVPKLPEAPGAPAQDSFAAGTDLDVGATGLDAGATGLPVSQIPPLLLEQVNQLHAELGYPPLDPGA